jgi:hypothetical protein
VAVLERAVTQFVEHVVFEISNNYLSHAPILLDEMILINLPQFEVR